MYGKKLFERIPIFGKVEIKLKNESNETFEKFNSEIERLKGVYQLGVLHEFLNIPPYRRYDYIMTKLYIIERASRYNSNFNFEKPLKLNGKIKFTSSEEFLKTWALLYSIGHLEMTFASEHAFLRYIQKDKEEFIDFIKNEIGLNLDDEKEKSSHENMIYENIKYLIENEKFMKLYKIFTLLKITKKDLTDSESYSDKICELSKIMFLSYEYLNGLNIERRNKIVKLINYFDVIRKLTFTILDGSISQNKLNLNYYVIFEDLDSFMENENYQNILSDINKFYTSDIFNSPESAYYHHRCVLNIQKKFNRFNFKELSKKFVNNDDDIKNKIEDAVSDLKKEINKKNQPVKENESTYKEYIQSELTNHIRINVDSRDLKKPITEEINSFKINRTFGGLLYNPAKNIYEIDFYPNSEISDKTATVYCVLDSINNFYDKFAEKKELRFVEVNLIKLYEKVKESKNPDFENEINEIQKQDDVISTLYNIFTSPLYTIIFLEKFKDLPNYLFFDTIKSNVRFSTWELEEYEEIDFPIFFRKSEIGLITKTLEKVKNVKKLELNNNLKNLKSEIDIEDETDDVFYIFSPNTYFLRRNVTETEIDFLLIKFLPSKNKRILKIGEIKPNGNFRSDQCIKQIQKAFNIPESTATALYEDVSSESNNKPIKIKMDGNVYNEIIIFEKSESLK